MRHRIATLLIALLSIVTTTAAWADRPHQVLILGDSLTEGYGVAPGDSYPSVLQQNLEKSGHPNTKIINGGISGSTSASALSRLKWSLKNKPDILVLALGANDGLRGLKPDDTEKNLDAVVRLARQNGMRVLLAGMKAPPNYGPRYTKTFARIYRDIAHKEKIPLIPFLLEGVAGERTLNQADGIHPNEKGHKIVAKNVQKYLEPLL
jgi:acyl-CoA thioesterase-1